MERIQDNGLIMGKHTQFAQEQKVIQIENEAQALVAKVTSNNAHDFAKAPGGSAQAKREDFEDIKLAFPLETKVLKGIMIHVNLMVTASQIKGKHNIIQVCNVCQEMQAFYVETGQK